MLIPIYTVQEKPSFFAPKAHKGVEPTPDWVVEAPEGSKIVGHYLVLPDCDFSQGLNASQATVAAKWLYFGLRLGDRRKAKAVAP